MLQQPIDSGPGADTSTVDGAVPVDGGDASTGPVTIAWLRQIGSSDDENSNSVALDSQGNAFVGGSFLASVKSGNVTLNNQGNDGTIDGFVMKLAPDGSTVAGKVFGGPKTQTVSKVAVDKQNTPFALVHFLGQAIVGSSVHPRRSPASTRAMTLSSSNWMRMSTTSTTSLAWDRAFRSLGR